MLGFFFFVACDCDTGGPLRGVRTSDGRRVANRVADVLLFATWYARWREGRVVNSFFFFLYYEIKAVWSLVVRNCPTVRSCT